MHSGPISTSAGQRGRRRDCPAISRAPARAIRDGHEREAAPREQTQERIRGQPMLGAAENRCAAPTTRARNTSASTRATRAVSRAASAASTHTPSPTRKEQQRDARHRRERHHPGVQPRHGRLPVRLAQKLHVVVLVLQVKVARTRAAAAACRAKSTASRRRTPAARAAAWPGRRAARGQRLARNSASADCAAREHEMQPKRARQEPGIVLRVEQ